MKKIFGIGLVMWFATGLGVTSPAAAQGQMDRLESEIRISNGPPATTVAAGQRVYLGAFADNDPGRGVKVLSVHPGGPADRAGLQPQDLIVAAAGRRIGLLSELSAILSSLNPGDRLALELLRGNRPLRIEVVLGAAPGAAQLGPPATPPSTGLGAGRTESIPPPPGEVAPAPEGPAFGAPLPKIPIDPSQTQIQELQHRVDQLERRVQALERALAESQRR